MHLKHSRKSVNNVSTVSYRFFVRNFDVVNGKALNRISLARESKDAVLIVKAEDSIFLKNKHFLRRGGIYSPAFLFFALQNFQRTFIDHMVTGTLNGHSSVI